MDWSPESIALAAEQTARELAEASRRAADLLVLFDTLYTGCAIGFACWDEHLHCLQINPSMAQIGHAQLADCHERPLADVLPSLAPVLEPLCRQVLAANTPRMNVEVTDADAPSEATARYWLASLYPTSMNQRQKPVRAVGMALTEITAQKRHEHALEQAKAHAEAGRDAAQAHRDTAVTARQQAEESSAAKNQTLAWVSHELRRPLTPVLMELSALLQDPTTSESLRAALDTMFRNLTLQAKLIEDLVDATRVSQSRIALRLEPVDMHRLIRQAVEVSAAEARAGELTVTVDLSAPLAYVSGDPRRLLQVLWNLLHNAVKFTPRGGTLWIRTRNAVLPPSGPPLPPLLVEVQDTGHGINTADLERVFQPFVQAGQAAASQRAGGLGLGLTLSRSLAELHGGTLTAASQGSGHGSTFLLTLPTIPVPA